MSFAVSFGPGIQVDWATMERHVQFYSNELMTRDL
jgi:hypothetical protein